MKTIFYKILYKGKDVVYVGITTRTINERFKEHIFSKSLNPNDYSIIEFDCVHHPEITSIEEFYDEQRKVSKLEQEYIKEELKIGSHLLNLSKGGEWNTSLLNKLRKDEFFKCYGSCENYMKFKTRKRKTRIWLHHWTYAKSVSRAMLWIKGWRNREEKVRSKIWLCSWVQKYSENISKKWIKEWVHHRGENRTKAWTYHWISNINRSKSKSWLSHWVYHKSINKSKKWVSSWVLNKEKRKN